MLTVSARCQPLVGVYFTADFSVLLPINQSWSLTCSSFLALQGRSYNQSQSYNIACTADRGIPAAKFEEVGVSIFPASYCSFQIVHCRSGDIVYMRQCLEHIAPLLYNNNYYLLQAQTVPERSVSDQDHIYI